MGGSMYWLAAWIYYRFTVFFIAWNTAWRPCFGVGSRFQDSSHWFVCSATLRGFRFQENIFNRSYHADKGSPSFSRMERRFKTAFYNVLKPVFLSDSVNFSKLPMLICGCETISLHYSNMYTSSYYESWIKIGLKHFTTQLGLDR